jgi:hypothetical protein
VRGRHQQKKPISLRCNIEEIAEIGFVDAGWLAAFDPIDASYRPEI